LGGFVTVMKHQPTQRSGTLTLARRLVKANDVLWSDYYFYIEDMTIQHLHRDPATLGLQDWPHHVLQKITDGVDVGSPNSALTIDGSARIADAAADAWGWQTCSSYQLLSEPISCALPQFPRHLPALHPLPECFFTVQPHPGAEKVTGQADQVRGDSGICLESLNKLWRQRQVILYEFEASLLYRNSFSLCGYRVSSIDLANNTPVTSPLSTTSPAVKLGQHIPLEGTGKKGSGLKRHLEMYYEFRVPESSLVSMHLATIANFPGTGFVAYFDGDPLNKAIRTVCYDNGQEDCCLKKTSN
ncbi:hypothetical protein STEG23_035038, partial [Scotinomys teguina]